MRQTLCLVLLAFAGCSSSSSEEAKGVSWTTVTSPLSDGLSSIAFGNGVFVGAGGKGDFASSSDGVVWTKEASIPGAYAIGEIFFDGARFVAAVLPDGKATLASATIYETPATLPLAWHAITTSTSERGPYKPVLLSGTTFYGATSASANNVIGRSTDLVSWTELYRDDSSTFFNSMAAGGGVVVAIGTHPKLSPLAAGSSEIYRSTDEKTWTGVSSPEFQAPDEYLGTELSSVAYGGGRFVVASPAWILTSPDALTWTRASASASGYRAFHRVRYSHDTFWVTGNGTIVTSTDGVKFTVERTGTDAPLWDVATGNGLAIAVGAQGTLLWRKL